MRKACGGNVWGGRGGVMRDRMLACRFGGAIFVVMCF